MRSSNFALTSLEGIRRRSRPDAQLSIDKKSTTADGDGASRYCRLPSIAHGDTTKSGLKVGVLTATAAAMSAVSFKLASYNFESLVEIGLYPAISGNVAIESKYVAILVRKQDITELCQRGCPSYSKVAWPSKSLTSPSR